MSDSGQVKLMDTLVAELKDSFANDKLVVVAGSGVSRSSCDSQLIDGCAVAGWQGLLLHGIEHCVNVERVIDEEEALLLRQQVASGRAKFLISTAEFIWSALHKKRPGAYRGWIAETIGQLRCVRPSLSLELAALGGILATLNYDDMLEQATGRKPLSWFDHDRVEQLLRSCRGSTSEHVLHLHGHFQQPDSMAFGQSSYQKLIADPHASNVLRVFALDRTLLFVGCQGTFQDPNFSQLIEWASEALADSTHRHFVLCRECELPQMERVPWLYPVAYGKTFEDLVPWVQRLRHGCRSSRPASPKTRAARVSGSKLDGYAKSIQQRYARLKLDSIDLTGSFYRELDLWRVFVPQTVRPCDDFLPQILEMPKEHLHRLRDAAQLMGSGLCPAAVEEVRRRYLDQVATNTFELMGESDTAHKRIVILGDPGSGKSSLLQALALRWADSTPHDRAEHPLPLLVELRAYSSRFEPSNPHRLVEFIAECHSTPSRT